MEFWQIYLLINILAAVFIIWPTLFVAKKHKQELRTSNRTDTNAEVYKDHVKDLENTLQRGEISEKELAGLKKDLEKTMVEENNMAFDESERPIISSFKSRLPVLVLTLALPLLSYALYSHLGSKKDWEIYELAKERVQSPPEQVDTMSKELISSLQDRLKERPENVQNWYLLASTAVERGDFEEGVRAYREILKIQPDAPLVKAELAQALFLRAGNTITPEVRQHTQEVLKVSPNMATALGLAGIDAYQSGEYETAIEVWQRALVQLDPSSAAAQALSGGIARAQSAINKTGKSVGTKPKKKQKVAGASLKVKVSIDKKKVKVDKDASVFIYARAWQGPKMPLAIQKIKVADLPKEIILDQTMSMTQGMDLSRFPQVEVVARISSTGSAISQSGDWQAAHGPIIVAGHKDPVLLKISEQIP